MKPLVPIVLIVTGGALIVAPMVHHLLLSDLMSGLLAKSQPAAVDLPASSLKNQSTSFLNMV